MKIHPLLLAALWLPVTPALAHPPGAPPAPPIKEIATQIGLDAQQTGEVERIFSEQRARMQEERRLLEASGQRPSREDMRTRFEQSRSELEAQLATVMTAEQLAAFRKEMQARRPRRGERDHDRDHAGDARHAPPAEAGAR